MACCGRGRAALAQNGRPAAIPAGPTVRLELTQPTSAFIRGPSTGRHYQFSAGAQIQPVDSRDAATLLKSGYFRLA